MSGFQFALSNAFGSFSNGIWKIKDTTKKSVIFFISSIKEIHTDYPESFSFVAVVSINAIAMITLRHVVNFIERKGNLHSKRTIKEIVFRELFLGSTSLGLNLLLFRTLKYELKAYVALALAASLIAFDIFEERFITNKKKKKELPNLFIKKPDPKNQVSDSQKLKKKLDNLMKEKKGLLDDNSKLISQMADYKLMETENEQLKQWKSSVEATISYLNDQINILSQEKADLEQESSDLQLKVRQRIRNARGLLRKVGEENLRLQKELAIRTNPAYKHLKKTHADDSVSF